LGPAFFFSPDSIVSTVITEERSLMPYVTERNLKVRTNSWLKAVAPPTWSA
jgi:hypothetical protein